MKIGELARATGISVRTLHHYEALGLLRPARRDALGHRTYGDRELGRLQQILSLRALGLSLREIGDLLPRRKATARDIVEAHLERVRAEIDARRRLLVRLESVAQRLRAGQAPTPEEFLRAIEETVMTERPNAEKYFTKEQIARLVARRAGLSQDDVRTEADAWRALIADVRDAHARGVSATDASLAPIAARWHAQLASIGGDEPDLRASLASLYRGEPGLAVQYGLDGGVDRFVGAMLRAHPRITRR